MQLLCLRYHLLDSPATHLHIPVHGAGEWHTSHLAAVDRLRKGSARTQSEIFSHLCNVPPGKRFRAWPSKRSSSSVNTAAACSAAALAVAVCALCSARSLASCSCLCSAFATSCSHSRTLASRSDFCCCSAYCPSFCVCVSRIDVVSVSNASTPQCWQQRSMPCPARCSSPIINEFALQMRRNWRLALRNAFFSFSRAFFCAVAYAHRIPLVSPLGL
jgi:hypothetical protein